MADEISDIVRQHDRDRYLSALFVPDDKRQDVLALYAFNAEIARIRYVVSEPQIGEIRLQFWADTLESMEQGGNSDHPVAQALQVAIRKHKLPVQPLLQLIEARRFDLYADPMPSLNDLEGYLGETSSVLIQLTAMILDRGAAETHAAKAGLAGVAYGLAQSLAQLPAMPALKPRECSAMDVVNLARKRLGEAREAALPEQLLPAFLPVSLTELYLAKVEANIETIETNGVEVSPWRRQWRIWQAARRGRF